MSDSVGFQESIQYLEDLYRLPFLPAAQVGLQRAQFLLSRLGDPHRAFRSVHVAGSCGKGSTTSFIASILQHAGFRVGSFRSPHLVSYTERIAVSEEDISQEDWTSHFAKILPIAEGMRAGAFPGYHLGRPTLFELLFALAALHFAETGIEWAAMETGLGGRLDATNLLQPDVAVVTNVSLEHSQILGSTVELIAREKAAIVKPASSAVTAAEAPALAVIEERAHACEVPLLRVGHEVTYSTSPLQAGQRVQLRAASSSVDAILTSMADYQALNAATAFASAFALRGRGVDISDDSIRRGLQHAHLPGRFERVSSSPPTILDGAHNAAAMQALADTLGRLQERPDVLLFAAMDDKDVEAMARAVSPHIGHAIVCPVPGTTRSAGTERMMRAFVTAGVAVDVFSDASTALRAAQDRAGKTGVLVAGSLYLVGFVRERLRSAVTA